MVHFVIDVQSDFLGGDDGLHADIHITIRSDREIAGHSELIALGKGNGAGVDMDRVSSNGHLLFLHLLVVLDVVDVQGDFLGRGDRLYLHIHIVVSDGQIAGHGELIALRKGNGAGVDMDRVSRNGHLFFLHLLVVLDVVDVQSDFLGRGDGLHADIHITIGSDREIAGHSELIAGGKGNGAGVDGGSVSRNLHHLFLHLLVVHFVVEVQGDFLFNFILLMPGVVVLHNFLDFIKIHDVELSVVDTPCFRCGKRRRRHQSDDQAEHQQNC